MKIFSLRSLLLVAVLGMMAWAYFGSKSVSREDRAILNNVQQQVLENLQSPEAVGAGSVKWCRVSIAPTITVCERPINFEAWPISHE